MSEEEERPTSLRLRVYKSDREYSMFRAKNSALSHTL